MERQDKDDKLTYAEIISVMIGVLLLIMLSDFVATYTVTGTNSYRQYVIYEQVKEQVPDLLLDGWEIEKISIFTISKTNFGDYEVYVKVNNDKIREWTNDWIITDKHGNILEEELTENMEWEEYYEQYK